jgi:CheY-like chemotaxis protein
MIHHYRKAFLEGAAVILSTAARRQRPLIRALTMGKKPIPIIGITAAAEQEEHAALLQAGKTAIYTKPRSKADQVSILARIRRVMLMPVLDIPRRRRRKPRQR